MTEFSYQLYSSRNFPPLADTLTMLTALGYTQVEGYGALYADRRQGRARRRSRPTASPCRPAISASTCWRTTAAGVLKIANATRHRRRSTAPISCPTSARRTAPGWRAFGERLQTAAAPYRKAGLGFGWHNHDFEFVKTADGAIPQDAIFERRPGSRMGSRHRLGRPRRRRPARLDRTASASASPRSMSRTSRPTGQNADEDGWADVGHGTVDWKAMLEGAEVHACQGIHHGTRQPEGPRAASRAGRSPPPRHSEGDDHMAKTLGVGIIGCGNISDRLLLARAALQGPRGSRLRRRQPGRRQGARRGVRRARRRPSTSCSPTPTSTSSST